MDHVRLAAGRSVDATVAALRVVPNVELVQPNYIRTVVAPPPPNDEYWLNNLLWGLAKIQAPATWTNFGAGNGSVVVAVLDTGVNYNHPDLAANMWRNPGEVPGNGVDDDGNGHVDDIFGIDTANHDSNPIDDHYHGTHVAGTIAAVGNNGIGVVGVNWNAKILACKFLNAAGQGSDADAIACFNYIVALKNQGVNIRVSNNSWGGFRDGQNIPQNLMAAINNASNAGILNVFAAGNANVNTDVMPFDPASLPLSSIVSVAASTPTDSKASFSNYGATNVDLAAPGEGIYSTIPSGFSYGSASGTSMATPHVAGAAALLFSLNGSLTVPGVKDVLMNNVDPVPQWTGLSVSGGRLNLYASAIAGFGNSPPAVQVTSPAAGASFASGSSILIQANATDSDGIVNQVTFNVDGNSIGIDTIAPFSATWASATAGSHVLTAIARDDDGALTTSAPVNITVLPPSEPPPSGSFTDTFNRADGPIGTNWLALPNQFGVASGHAIVGQRARAVGGPGGFAFSAWNGGAIGTDHFSEIRFTTAAAYIGSIVRASAAGAYFWVNFGNDLRIYRMAGGGFSELRNGIPVPALNSLVRLTIEGSTLTLSVNGAAVASVQDPVLTTGGPGILAYNDGSPNAATLDDWSGGAVGTSPPPPPPPPPPSGSFTDTFDRADGPIGANWLALPNQFGVASGHAIVGQRARAVGGPGGFAFSAWNGGTIGADHFSEIRFTTTAAYIGSIVRGSAAGAYFWVNFGNDLRIYRLAGGAFTELRNGIPVPALNALVRLTIQGSTLTLSVNGAAVASVQDSVLITGGPGILAYSDGSPNAATLDDWSGGTP
jgi:subtilisin family serine protease